MEQKRLKGRGLEEVAHLFFSSQSAPGGMQDRRAVPPEEQPSAKVFLLISFVEDLPTSLFTANLSLEISYRQKKVLVADTATGIINIFFALGMERSLIPIQRLMTGESREVVVTGPFGIRIFTFPLDPTGLALLRSIQPGHLFRSLVREERRNDVLLINMDPSPFNPFDSTPQIFADALEILCLTPSDPQGLKSCYRFVKSILRHHPRSRFGVLLYHEETADNAEERFGRLAEAVTKFLGRKLKGYGHLAHDTQLYLSLLRGQPLCRKPERDENVQVLAEMAKKLLEQSAKETPLHDLLRSSNQQLLVETLSVPAASDLPAFPSASLSREEEIYFDRISVSDKP
jgi:MinD-like ATPase involved in chromosome partitioning or flagellar assembly